MCGVVVPALLISGCLLIGIRGPKEFVLERPYVGTIWGEGTAKQYSDRVHEAEFLREVWGAPNTVESIRPGTERWTYTHGWKLPGLMLIVGIVPVPAYIPLGRERASFIVERGQLVRATGTETRTLTGVACGLSWHHFPIPGCWVLHDHSSPGFNKSGSWVWSKPADQ